MTQKPIIGITIESEYRPDDARFQGMLKQPWNYSKMVAEAGGVPILLPPATDMAAVAPMLDGWLLPGGEDIPASYWGDDNHAAAVPADGTRFESERALFAALDPRTPIFGICYGSQCLNVLHGGSLDQHVPDRVGHNDHATGEVQTYDVVPGTALAGLVGSQALGKSYHHQAVGRLGDGLVVNATYADGTIEGVEGTGPRWMIGVQWHPERTPDDPGSLALLRSFVAAAAEYRADRAKLSHIP